MSQINNFKVGVPDFTWAYRSAHEFSAIFYTILMFCKSFLSSEFLILVGVHYKYNIVECKPKSRFSNKSTINEKVAWELIWYSIRLCSIT